MTTIQAEFDRLASIYQQLGGKLKTCPPATEKQIASIAEITGIEVDESLKDLWRISNGSRAYQNWFVGGDELEPTPYVFMSIEDVVSNWKLFEPYDKEHYARWFDNEEEYGERDARVQRHFIRHSKWLSFAEFNGGSNAWLFDADPTEKGTYGQIIQYLHDPDGIFYCTSNILSIFSKSNDILEETLDEEPEWLDDLLEIERSKKKKEPSLTSNKPKKNKNLDLKGILIAWPEVVGKRLGYYETQSAFGIIDEPYGLLINDETLFFVDDGLKIDFGPIKTNDHIEVKGVNEIYINGELRKPILE
ncbi:MAG: SMI1/KNR4 family protein [Pirellulales bacterium]